VPAIYRIVNFTKLHLRSLLFSGNIVLGLVVQFRQKCVEETLRIADDTGLPVAAAVPTCEA